MDPAAFLKPNGEGKDYGLVVLNQPIDDDNVFSHAWKYCGVRVCADGGANRLYDYFGRDEKRRKAHLPDYITGDLDSLRPEVGEYYKSLGVSVIHNPDQYSTDFMKAVRLLKEKHDNGDNRDKGDKYAEGILALGAMGGRVDQSFHSIHHLYLSHRENVELVLVSSESISILLGTGKTWINTPQTLVGKTCGIIPLEGSTIITTSGLEWDVSEWETSYATQMSTSNHIVADQVSIECDKPVLFTMEIRKQQS